MSILRRTVASSSARSNLGLAAYVLVALVAAPAQAQTATDEDALDGAAALGWVNGSESSQITIVEFTDVSCPYCASFHGGTRAELIREYVDSGKVQWITLTYISGLYKNSEAVSIAAECAGRQGHYDAFTAAVYESRDDWVDADASTVSQTVERLARSTQLDAAAFEACTVDPTVAQRLEDVASLATAKGVRGTPTWFVDGFLVMGDLPFGYARSFVERRLPSG